MPPSRDQTGVPGLVAFAHFHSSTMSGSVSRMIRRTVASVAPRQSPSSLILASIFLEASDVLVAMDQTLPKSRRELPGGRRRLPGYEVRGMPGGALGRVGRRGFRTGARGGFGASDELRCVPGVRGERGAAAPP